MTPERENRRVDASDRTVALMAADCQLADDIELAQERPRSRARTALLTGATGFLGAYAARQLLAHPALRLVCLVRAADDEQALQRVRDALAARGVAPAVIAARVRAIRGDLGKARLGLEEGVFEELALNVDRIYHLGATVNWSKGYEQLRTTNVLGCLELLKLAVHRRLKPMLFVSTIAVCYAQGSDAAVDERTDMTPRLRDMPLAYAQTKWVAESLLRRAADRGLPVTILRPALISGDSRTGASNPDDLLAAVVEATVASGVAMDCDWQIDCVPVDFVASAVCKSLGSVRGCEVIHLVHDRPRAWRELALWLHLQGHALRLVDEQRWREQVFDAVAMRHKRLYGYRVFFNGSARAGLAPLFSTYLGKAQRRISHAESRATLRRLRLAPAPLDRDLLERYLASYRLLGLLPPPAAAGPQPPSQAALNRHQDAVLTAISRARAQPAVDGAWVETPLQAADHGILHGIAAAHLGAGAGVRRFRWSGPAGEQPTDVIVKTKPVDSLLMHLSSEFAAFCAPGVGAAMREHAQDLGLAGGHERELVFYESGEPGLRHCLPRTCGTLREPQAGLWTVTMEHVTAAPEADPLGVWPAHRIAIAIEAIAGIHAIWYARNGELESGPLRLAPEQGAQRMLRRRPLWQELQRHAQPAFTQWAGDRMVRRHSAIVDDPRSWLAHLHDGPRGVIHNDFNPRNLLFAREGADEKLRIIDWELARIGLPQHDLAEFLCFVLQPERVAAEAPLWIETHRRRVGFLSGTSPDAALWNRGFAASLDYLLAERLPLYAVIHCLKPQPWLARVTRTWLALRQLLDASAEMTGASRRP